MKNYNEASLKELEVWNNGTLTFFSNPESRKNIIPTSNPEPRQWTSLVCYVDGASSGNPGPAGIGVAIYNEKGDLLTQISEFIGKATNNVAEYTAVIKALEYALSQNTKKLTIFSDSELIVKQLTGKYLIKNAALKTLAFKASKLIDKLTKVKIIHIPREKNKLADKLAGQAIKKVESCKVIK